ncbi:hypothetical protein BGZ54_009612 [Gamsiella multidivaricata]|nr:hypothetical protein BGZ54_009612 [Gamsiella multidivaricata]
MKNVRDWLKERNPSMISPPLSANSELSIATITRANRQSSTILSPKMVGSTGEIDGLHKPHKRKAFRQLAPSMGSKKLARNEGENCRRGAEQGGTYPPSHETIVSIPRPQLISHSSELSGTLHREYTNKSAVNSSDSNNIYTKAHDPLRDQPETDSFFPPVNWSRFQQQDRARPHTRPPPSVVDADALPSSEFTFRMTPTQISNQAFTRTIGGRDADGVAISPLIRLRQSQLKQRQQEDFLGIKADKNSSSRRAAESGGLTFNETLEAWEREDDEELARNAAREEAEMEALGQHQDGFLSSSSLEEDRKVNPVASNTSASSLLRTVPFNGESSRRPEPSFNSMKPLQEPAAKDSGDAVAKTLPSSLDRQPFNIHGFSSSLGRPDDRHSVLVASESAPEPRLFSSTSQKEDTYNRRQKRPGLYTPSKKNRTFDATTLLDRVPPQSPQTSTPTVMNRYIQLSSLSDEECT